MGAVHSREPAHKVTLSSKKVVLIRELKIKHQTLASKAVGNRAGDNSLLMGTLMSQELLKILLISIDNVPVEPAQLEDLDGMFTFVEYQQVTKFIGRLMGGDEGEFQTEIVPGSK